MQIDYAITAHLKPQRHRAVRMAVFSPVLGNWWARPDLVRGAFDALRKQWYARLGQLKKAGWPPARNKLKLQYIANCPPFGVRLVRGMIGKCCGYAHICPFCWGRDYVYKGFTFLERALYGGTAPDAKPYRGVTLVEASSTGYYSAAAGQGWTVSCLRDKVWPAVRRDFEARGNDVRRQQALAAVTLFRLCPLKEALAVTRSTLALTFKVAADPAWAKEAGGRRVLTVHEDPTRHKLANAFGRAFAYPKGLMYGDAEMTVALLGLLQRRRLFATYGKDASLHEEFQLSPEMAEAIAQAKKELEGVEIPNLDDDVVDDEGAAYKAAEEEYQ